MRGFSEQCCDFGLVHHVDFRVRGSKVEVRAGWRAKAAARRMECLRALISTLMRDLASSRRRDRR